jgi:hypothetical protein
MVPAGGTRVPNPDQPGFAEGDERGEEERRAAVRLTIRNVRMGAGKSLDLRRGWNPSLHTMRKDGASGLDPINYF